MGRSGKGNRIGDRMGDRMGKKEVTDKKDTIKEEGEEEGKESTYSDIESHSSSEPELNSNFVFPALVGGLVCATWYWCWVRSLTDEVEQRLLYSL